jgi:hypothetical protein
MSRRVLTFANRATKTLNALDSSEVETEKAVAIAQYKTGRNFLNRAYVVTISVNIPRILSSC